MCRSVIAHQFEQPGNVFTISDARERSERATRTERAAEAARERACGGVRAAKPFGYELNSGGGPLITCRTSIGMFSGLPSRPGAAEASAAIS